MARSRVRIDNEKQILRKMYRPGEALAVMSKEIERDAVLRAKSNNGKGWQYNKPGGKVTSGHKGEPTQHGNYARGIDFKPGSGSRPRMELRATAPHSELVEYGNGSAPIRRRQASSVQKSKAIRWLNAESKQRTQDARRDAAILKAKMALAYEKKNWDTYKELLADKDRQNERYKEWAKGWQKRMAKAQDHVARFNLDVPGGRAMPKSVRPMGRGLNGGIAEFGGYHTINRAMRRSVKKYRDGMKKRR
jgi:hypothetical protein